MCLNDLRANGHCSDITASVSLNIIADLRDELPSCKRYSVTT